MDAEFTPIFNDFATTRLTIRNWLPSMRPSVDKTMLAARLVPILTKTVLEHLPPSLQVDQTADAALAWIDARTDESDVYLVKLSVTGELVGLMILVSETRPGRGVCVHIGYLFSQAAWGKGYATELLKGVLKQAKKRPPITLVGGVEKGNEASAHILRKVGFTQSTTLNDDTTDVFKAVIE